jgi:hypothetical protein
MRGEDLSRKGAKTQSATAFLTGISLRLCVFARESFSFAKKQGLDEKSAAVFAVRRANYTHRRKGVFNVQSIEDLKVAWQCSLPYAAL